MKVLIVLATFLLAANAAEKYCYQSVVQSCMSAPSKRSNTILADCDAKYGAIESLLPDLQRYANVHIQRSMEYLLMSTHFGNYEKSRVGFEKFFREMSDSKWDEGIDLIKYIAKRGGHMTFSAPQVDNAKGEESNYELYELHSFAKALDIEKHLAAEAHNIHGEATRRRDKYHDPEVSSYIENEFVHKQADTVRKLSGFTSDLSRLLSGPEDSSLSLYLFDEYLQKL